MVEKPIGTEAPRLEHPIGYGWKRPYFASSGDFPFLQPLLANGPLFGRCFQYQSDVPANQKILRGVKRFSDVVFGSWVDELFWKLRSFKVAKSYFDPEVISRPYESFMKVIEKYKPFDSILDVGTASGAQLYRLNKRFPGTRLYGTDITFSSIWYGRKWFKRKGIKVDLRIANACRLPFPDKSIDILISDGTLVCIGPDKVEKAVKELLRVARKAIILHEWHGKTQYLDHWVHDYRELFKGCKINFIRSPSDGSTDERWREFGYLIEVSLDDK